MAKLDEASDEEMLEGGGIVLEDAAPRHISSVSETGAKAGNHAAAAALRARLHGGSRIPLSTHPSPCLTCSSLQRPPKACRGISIIDFWHRVNVIDFQRCLKTSLTAKLGHVWVSIVTDQLHVLCR